MRAIEHMSEERLLKDLQMAEDDEDLCLSLLNSGKIARMGQDLHARMMFDCEMQNVIIKELRRREQGENGHIVVNPV